MSETPSYTVLQYQLVRQSRNVLFDYCRTLSQADLLCENSSFGRGGSIRNLLVHIANTYEFWIMHHALGREISFTPYPSKNSIDEIAILFSGIDNSVTEFLATYSSRELQPLTLEINGNPKNTCAFELFTHVITHEFHHKGQILSISRHLGYIPVDTDVIR